MTPGFITLAGKQGMIRGFKIAGKILATLVLALLGLIACALIVIHFCQREWTPADVEVNMNPRLPVLKAANIQPDSAFDLLRRATQSFKVQKAVELHKEVTRLNLEPWSVDSFPLTAQALQENEPSLALARRAAVAANPQVPTMVSVLDSLSYVTQMLRLAEVFRISAARKVAQGDLAGAYDDLETSIAFAQIVSRGGPLLSMLVEAASEMGATSAMRLIALQQNVPPVVARNAIQRLLEADRTSEPLAETMRQEFRLLPSIVDICFSPSAPSLFAMGDDDVSKAEHGLRTILFRCGWLFGSTRESMTPDLTRVHKVLVKSADEPYSAREMQRLEENVLPSVSPKDQIWLRDPAGYILARSTLPTLAPAFTRYHRKICDLRATALVLAVRQFQQAQGRLPKDLPELVPGYLTEIPIDPYYGRPLRYRILPDGQWVIYSVGPNQTDEGGGLIGKEPRKYRDPGDLVFGEYEVARARERLSKSTAR